MAYSRQELVELGWSFDDACDYYLDYIDEMYGVVGTLVDERNKLRELVLPMARALGVNTDWCLYDCSHEFGCQDGECHIACTLSELGIEV